MHISLRLHRIKSVGSVCYCLHNLLLWHSWYGLNVSLNNLLVAIIMGTVKKGDETNQMFAHLAPSDWVELSPEYEKYQHVMTSANEEWELNKYKEKGTSRPHSRVLDGIV